MKVGRWSTTAGNNNSAPPDGWPEGQAPSTVNDCARENMAAIRTAFADLQYFDQDFTPTFISATSFSVPGNQTSAIHAGRRLKLFTGTTRYGTVSTASFTTVTTIDLALDDGSLTSSLSSFGISVLGNENNALPRRMNLSVSELTVIAGAGIGALGVWSTLTVSGAAVIQGNATFKGNVSVSGTCVAVNTAKAWVRFSPSSHSSNAACYIQSGFNVATVSQSATAGSAYRITFTNGLADANYAFQIQQIAAAGTTTLFPKLESAGASSIKFVLENAAGAQVVPISGYVNAVFLR